MKNMSVFFLLFASILLGVSSAQAATVSIASSGRGVYIVQGTDLNSIGAVDLTISYDTKTLATPQITQGSLASGAMMAANPNYQRPGFIKVGLITGDQKGISGSGTIVTITFKVIGSSPGPVQIVGSSLINTSMGNVAADIQNQNQPPSEDQNSVPGPVSGSGAGAVSSSGSGSGSTSNSVGSSSSARLGGVLSTEKTKEEPPAAVAEPEKVKEETSMPAMQEEPQAVTKTPGSEKKSVFNKAVLERFRLFQGEKSPKNLINLFDGIDGVVQDPKVLLTDGKTKATVSIKHNSSGKRAPNFALKGVKLLSFRTEGDSVWVIELLPDKGVFKAAIIILQDGRIIEIPLTVAPPYPAEGNNAGKVKLTEADFMVFLNERGPPKEPRFDLNGDGIRDYIDDYIFTANFIAQNGQDLKGKANTKK